MDVHIHSCCCNDERIIYEYKFTLVDNLTTILFTLSEYDPNPYKWMKLLSRNGEEGRCVVLDNGSSIKLSGAYMIFSASDLCVSILWYICEKALMKIHDYIVSNTSKYVKILKTGCESYSYEFINNISIGKINFTIKIDKVINWRNIIKKIKNKFKSIKLTKDVIINSDTDISFIFGNTIVKLPEDVVVLLLIKICEYHNM